MVPKMNDAQQLDQMTIHNPKELETALLGDKETHSIIRDRHIPDFM